MEPRGGLGLGLCLEMVNDREALNCIKALLGWVLWLDTLSEELKNCEVHLGIWKCGY